MDKVKEALEEVTQNILKLFDDAEDVKDTIWYSDTETLYDAICDVVVPIVNKQQARIEELTAQNQQLKDRLGAIPDIDEMSKILRVELYQRSGIGKVFEKMDRQQRIKVTDELAKALSARINGEVE